jgi:hypothetical protein
LIEQFKLNTLQKTVIKAPGYYLFTKKRAVIPMDIFKVPGKDKDDGMEFGVDLEDIS